MMAQRTKVKHTGSKASPGLIRHALVAIPAFALGVLLTWLMMRSPARNSESPALPLAEVARPETLGVGMPGPQRALALANWHYDRKNWREAIKHYEEAIALGLDNPDVRTDLGSAYRFSGEPLKALELYQFAQKQNPQHENSLFNQASLYSQTLHQPAPAIAVLNAYLARFPQSVNAGPARQALQELQSQSPSAAGLDSNTRARVSEWLNSGKSEDDGDKHFK
jgi:tetratricopeptide (TPR) repeat protein